MERLAELLLGIIGGIAALIGSIFVLGFGGIGAVFEAEGAESIIGLGLLAIFMSIIGIIGAALVDSRPKLGGSLMVISAIVGFIAVSFAYLFGGILLLIAGILGLVRKTGERKIKK